MLASDYTASSSGALKTQGQRWCYEKEEESQASSRYRRRVNAKDAENPSDKETVAAEIQFNERRRRLLAGIGVGTVCLLRQLPAQGHHSHLWRFDFWQLGSWTA
jgi:hypothetical protein